MGKHHIIGRFNGVVGESMSVRRLNDLENVFFERVHKWKG
jgi:hypothetical protein